MPKIRTQIQLDQRDHARLKAYASRHRISMAAAVRVLIQRALGGPDRSLDDRWERCLGAAGKGREEDGRRDVARHHDEYLYGEQQL